MSKNLYDKYPHIVKSWNFGGTKFRMIAVCTNSLNENVYLIEKSTKDTMGKECWKVYYSSEKINAQWALNALDGTFN